MFHKVIREGLFEKATLKMGPEYKNRAKSWATAFQAEGRDSEKVLSYV